MDPYVMKVFVGTTTTTSSTTSTSSTSSSSTSSSSTSTSSTSSTRSTSTLSYTSTSSTTSSTSSTTTSTTSTTSTSTSSTSSTSTSSTSSTTTSTTSTSTLSHTSTATSSTSSTTSSTSTSTSSTSTSSSTWSTTSFSSSSSTGTTKTSSVTSLTATTTSKTETKTSSVTSLTATTTSKTETKVLSVVALMSAVELRLDFRASDWPLPLETESIVECAELFDSDLVLKLGLLAECRWSAQLLLVQLGPRATLLVGDPIAVTLPGGPEFLRATVARDPMAPLVLVRAALAAPEAALPCARLRFSTDLSSGDAGRVMLVTWTLGNASGLDTAAREAIESRLRRATLASESALDLDPLAEEGSSLEVNVSFQIIVRLTNWQGSSDTAQAYVHVSSTNLAPQMVPATLPEVEIDAQEEVELKVTFQASSCGGGGQVQIQWAYRLHVPLASWQSLESARLVDSNPSPAAVRLEAMSLVPGLQHQFRVQAAFEGSGLDLPALRSEQIFTVSIRPMPRPTVVILGPAVVSARCAFELTSASYASGHAELQQLWSCRDLAADLPCDLGTRASAASLAVPAEALSVGLYNFSLRVWRSLSDMQSSSSGGFGSWLVQVEEAHRPVMVLELSWVEGQRLSIAPNSAAVLAEGRVEQQGACRASDDIAWQWVLVRGDLILASLATQVTSLDTSLSITTADFPTELLERGLSYSYVLLGRPQSSSLPTSGDTLNQTMADLLLARSPSFVADGAPRQGRVELRPVQGEAVTTAFEILTHSWQDEEVDRLVYKFYAFPKASLEKVGLETINWANPESARYFRKQGGKMLRGWAADAESFDQRFSPGEYVLVCRARDHLGAKGIAVSSNFTVTAATLTTEQRAEVLEASLSTADGQQILSTVSALVATESGSDVDAFGSAAGSSLKLVSALQVAAQNLDPTPEVLEEMAVVATSVVDAGRTTSAGAGAVGAVGAGGDATLLETAILLDSCIDLTRQTETGAGRQVATAMLGAINAINEASQTSNETRLPGKVAELVTDLGAAMLSSLDTASWEQVEGPNVTLCVATSASNEVFDNLSIDLSDSNGSRRLQVLDGVKGAMAAMYRNPSAHPFTWADYRDPLAWSGSAVKVLEFQGYSGLATVRVAFPWAPVEGMNSLCVLLDEGSWSSTKGSLSTSIFNDKVVCDFTSDLQGREVLTVALQATVNRLNWFVWMSMLAFTVLIQFLLPCLFGTYKFETRERYRNRQSLKEEERREAWPDESPRPPITALEPRSAVLEPGAERRGTPRNAAESEGEQTVDLEEPVPTELRAELPAKEGAPWVFPPEIGPAELPRAEAEPVEMVESVGTT
ncbi:unnamed protein product [Durusdinium trenchii]|uniref:GPS domain-containing protein n=1 Tax=Durusdinium trenchii TaxID=1381693 RepID=A0ABP0QXL5_9DINO